MPKRTSLTFLNITTATAKSVTFANHKLLRDKLDNDRIVEVHFRVESGPYSHRISIMVDLDEINETEVVEVAKQKAFDIGSHLTTAP